MVTRFALWALTKRLTMLCCVLATVACSSVTRYPNAPASGPTQDYNYLIGPGDNVNIIVWRNPDLSTNVPVRPDGKITVPLVEDLPAI